MYPPPHLPQIFLHLMHFRVPEEMLFTLTDVRLVDDNYNSTDTAMQSNQVSIFIGVFISRVCGQVFSQCTDV